MQQRLTKNFLRSTETPANRCIDEEGREGKERERVTSRWMWRKRKKGACGCISASSTAGPFYFMNRNISRDNWTRGAATAKLRARTTPRRVATVPARTRAREESTKARHNARTGGDTSPIHWNECGAVVALFLEEGACRDPSFPPRGCVRGCLYGVIRKVDTVVPH